MRRVGRWGVVVCGEDVGGGEVVMSRWEGSGEKGSFVD